MTEINPPGFLQNGGNTHTAEILRSSYSGLMHGVRASSSLVARGGVVPGMGGALAVTQNGVPNMSVNVASGQAYIPGTEGTKQATYVVVNDASKNITISAADGSNPRIDLIVAKVQDSLYSGATNTWSLVTVTGTPSGTPAAPTAPANSIVLARVAVAAGVTSIVTANITDYRFYAAALGGTIICTSATRPDTATVPGGTEIWETDTSLARRLISGTWYLAEQHRQISELGAPAASVTFSNIPTSLRRIKILWTVRGDASSAGEVRMRINGDSAANYRFQSWNVFGVGTTQYNGVGLTSIPVGAHPVGAGAGDWGGGWVEIVGWNAPHATYLTGVAQGGYISNTAGASNNQYLNFAYLGSSASGYTSITLLNTAGNMQAGSQFLLEGWD